MLRNSLALGSVAAATTLAITFSLRKSNPRNQNIAANVSKKPVDRELKQIPRFDISIKTQTFTRDADLPKVLLAPLSESGNAKIVQKNKLQIPVAVINLDRVHLKSNVKSNEHIKFFNKMFANTADKETLRQLRDATMSYATKSHKLMSSEEWQYINNGGLTDGGQDYLNKEWNKLDEEELELVDLQRKFK